MSGADGAPNEEVGQARQGKQPCEDGALFCGLANERQEAECDLNDDTPDRTTAAVDIGEELGSHTSLGHGLHRTGGAKCARVGDRDDGQGDDGVEDGGKNFDTSILDSQDERTGLGVGTAGAQQSLVVRSDDESKDKEIDNVEEEDTPEDLLSGARDRLPWVGGLGSSKTNKFGSAKRESSSNENRAEAVEAVSEGTGLVPVLGAQVSLVADPAAVDDNTEDNEANTSANLDHGKDEFDFSVSTDTEYLYGGEDDKEDGDPDTHVEIISPERDGDGSGDKFEG